MTQDFLDPDELGLPELLSGLTDPELAAPPVADHLVVAAAAFIRRSGAVKLVDDWRSEDREGLHAGGRPPSMGTLAVLTCFHLLASTGTPLLVTRFDELVTKRLSPASRQLLGITEPDSADHSYYSRCWRAIHSLLQVVDAFPGSRLRLTAEQQKEVHERRDPADQAKRLLRTFVLTNTLIFATWKLLPPHVGRRYKGNVAIDATPIRAGGHCGKNFKTTEYDAGLYKRSKRDKGSDGDDAGPHGKSKSEWAWDGHLAVALPNHPGDPQTFPLLVLALSFDQPAFAPGLHARALLEWMHHCGFPPGIAVWDNAYVSADPDKLQKAAATLGYVHLGKLKGGPASTNQLGKRGVAGGFILVEGALYCPAMSERLINATIDFRAGRLSTEEYSQLIKEREAWATRDKGRPDANGNRVVMCPAAGPHPTASCPLKPQSVTLVKRPATVNGRKRPGPKPRTRITVAAESLPKAPDSCCTQESVVIKFDDIVAKYLQAFPYGSPEWEAHDAMRNTVEGYNGYAKDSAREALAEPGRRRIRGRTAQHLLCAFLIVAANIRKISTFLKETHLLADDPALETEPARLLRPQGPPPGSLPGPLPLSGVPPGIRPPQSLKYLEQAA